MVDLFRPGAIRSNDFVDATEVEQERDPKVTVQIQEPVVSGGVMLERDRSKARGITGSTPLLGLLALRPPTRPLGFLNSPG